MDHAMLLPDSRETANSPEPRQENPVRTGAIVMGDAPGAAGWNKEILNIID
jgi:hypothetical protein